MQSVSRIKNNKARWLFFLSILTTFKLSIILEAAGAELKIGSSLKPKTNKQEI